MSDRDQVFGSIRNSLAKARKAREPASLPEWDSSIVISRPLRDAVDLIALFGSKFESVGGKLVHGFASLSALFAECAQGGRLGFVDPVLRAEVEASGALKGFEVTDSFNRDRVDDYAFGITRATAGIAESGSLVITGGDTASRLGALAPWVHVAVLEKARIVPAIADAIALFGSERNAVFVTGPSKTADVEGILIKGVHGPGVQVCCLI